MTKITKTYSGLCITCNGYGRLPDLNTGTSTQRMCPVCKGNGTLIIIETSEPLYSIEINTKFKNTPIQIIKDRLHMEDEIGFVLPPHFYKVRRKQAGLTLRYIAKEIGVSPATIQRIENGNQCLAVNYNALIKFWKKYGTHTDK